MNARDTAMTSPTSVAPSSPPPKVAILFSLALEGERNMCRGILDYAKAHGPWRCHLVEGRPEEQLMNLKSERFDGIIAAGGSHRENDAYASVGVPFVLLEPRPDMLDESGASSVPFVMRDSRAIGALAAAYYLERGYRSFAFVGETNRWYWNAERRIGFVDALARAGFGCAMYDTFTARERKSWTVERPRMERFLLSLPRPTAVFAVMDGRARYVVNLCAEIGLRVPEDIAVLGVDNDPLLCESTVPPLSSIRTGGYRRGFVAAEMLDALMHGRRPARRAVALPPLSVVTRGSTGYDAMKNPAIARAVTFIRSHAATGSVSVPAVARAAGCSRSYLDKHFRSGLGLSVREAVLRERIERVKTLVSSTNQTMTEIAADCGFARDSHLARLFKETTGLTMRQWRRENHETPDE